MEIAIVSKFFLFVVRGKGKKDGWGEDARMGKRFLPAVPLSRK